MALKLIREIIPIEEWIESEYYLGREVYAIRPFWKRQIIRFFREGYSSFIFYGGKRTGKCVVGDTRILTDKGYKKIEDLSSYRVEDSFTPLEVGVSSDSKSSHFYYGGVKPTIKISSPIFELEGTYVHPVMTVNDNGFEWKQLQDIKVGDWVVSDRKMFKDFPFSNPVEKPSCLSHLSDFDFGWLLGFWLGDGFVQKDCGGLGFALGSKEEVGIVSSLLGNISYSVFRKEGSDLGHSLILRSGIRKLSCGRSEDREVWETLKSIGFEGNSETKKIPEWVFSSNKEVISGVISGLIDSDGYVKGSVDFTVKSKFLSYGMRDLLHLFGVFPCIRIRSVKYKGEIRKYFRLIINKYYSFNLKDILGLKVLHKYENLKLNVLNGLGKSVSFCVPKFKFIQDELIKIRSKVVLSRKECNKLPLKGRRKGRILLNTILAYVPGLRKYGHIGETFLSNFYTDKNFFEIKNVEYLCDKPVYDLAVPGTHSFSANGIVNHNSYIPEFLVLRLLYEQSCIADLPVYFGLSPTTVLKYFFISMSMQKAKNTGLRRLLSIFDKTPYWRENCPRNKEINSCLDLPFAQVFIGSDVTHIIGEDTFCVLFDESDFVKSAKGEEYQKAKEIYAEAEMRIHLTYAVQGQFYGLLGLMSSAGFETSFTEQEIKIARKNPDKVLLVEVAAYDVYDDKYSPNKFKVFLGLKEINPHIVGEVPVDCDRSEYYIDAATRQYISQNFGMVYEQILQIHTDLVIEVPEDFRSSFERDINYAIQSIAGRPISSSGKFLNNFDWIKRVFETTHLRNPLLVETPLLTVGSDEVIQDYIDEQILMSNYEEGQRVYFHIDSSKKNDKTGFAAVYKSSTGVFRTLLYFHAFRQPGDTEIDIQKVLDTIFWLLDLGIYVRYASYDMAAGGDMARQEIARRLGKDKQGYLSVDKTDEQYLLFNLALKRGYVDIYDYAPFVKEYKNLTYDKAFGKIDHPKENEDGTPGEKDTCDAVIGAVFNAYSFEGMGLEDFAVSKENTTYEPELEDPEGFYTKETEDVDDFYGKFDSEDKFFIAPDGDDSPENRMRKRLSR